MRQLPREARTRRLLQGHEVRWGDLEHLAANMVDASMLTNWLLRKAWFQGNPPPPDPMPRPGDPPKGRRIGGLRAYPPDELRRIIASARPKGEVTDVGSS